MNNDYKSALSKIHLDDMKKEQMKQLFKKKHMNKKNKIIKSVVAAAAAVAIVVGTVSVGKMLGVKQDDSESFTLQVNAKEMKRADQVDVPDDYVYEVSLSGDDGDAVTYDTSFPITCKGKNIRTVTYSIQGAIFTVTNPINERIVIDGQKPDEDLWIPAGYNGMSKVKKEAHQYKSFTVDYKRQESENTLISIGYNSKVYSKERLYEIYCKYHSKAVFTPEGLAEVYKEFYRDVVIKCTVTFNNGKTATKEITVSAKPEVNENGDGSITGDNGTVVTCYHVK